MRQVNPSEEPSGEPEKRFSLGDYANLVAVLTFLGTVFGPLAQPTVRTALASILKVPNSKVILFYYCILLVAALGFALSQLTRAKEMAAMIAALKTKPRLLEASPTGAEHGGGQRPEAQAPTSRTLKRQIAQPHGQAAGFDGAAMLPDFILDYIEDIERDAISRPGRYTCLAVEQDVEINAFGDYTAAYTHEVMNDSDTSVSTYTFDLRTTERIEAADLSMSAKASINGGSMQKADVQCANAMRVSEAHMPIRVELPAIVGIGGRFKVELSFKWPRAVRNGRDGDALNLLRFKKVLSAKFKITCTEPVYQGSWWWKNPQTKTVEPYPFTAHVGDNTSELILNQAQTSEKAIYLFIGYMQLMRAGGLS